MIILQSFYEPLMIILQASYINLQPSYNHFEIIL
jgi:hypothetical protein